MLVLSLAASVTLDNLLLLVSPLLFHMAPVMFLLSLLVVGDCYAAKPSARTPDNGGVWASDWCLNTNKGWELQLMAS